MKMAAMDVDMGEVDEFYVNIPHITKKEKEELFAEIPVLPPLTTMSYEEELKAGNLCEKYLGHLNDKKRAEVCEKYGFSTFMDVEEKVVKRDEDGNPLETEQVLACRPGSRSMASTKKHEYEMVLADWCRRANLFYRERGEGSEFCKEVWDFLEKQLKITAKGMGWMCVFCEKFFGVKDVCANEECR